MAGGATARVNCQVFDFVQAMHRDDKPSRLFTIASKNSWSAGQYSPQVRQRFSAPSSVTVPARRSNLERTCIGRSCRFLGNTAQDAGVQ